MDAVGLCPPQEPRDTAMVSDQEAHEAKDWVANEALAIYILTKVPHRCS